VFDQFSGAKLTTWMQAFCAERGCTLGAREARLIVSRVGSESWVLLTELAKLCAWQGTGAITTDGIELLTSPADPQSNVFALTDALARRDKRAVLRELADQLAHGADPTYLLSMYAFAIRNMLMVKDVAGRGAPPRTIASVTGLHPFVVTKTLTATAGYAQDRLLSAHAWLAEGDRAVKGGRWDATDALYDFVLSVV
jgi:DNA polymerase III delta subunit